ncbi:TNT domain-containing protein [Cellulomonas timonensis]|uniref:TNT domain-containing protein n=1 Tax=Cellulomonas timonensis TaxID=1689271 RepID=UPI000829DE4C|nr:TNT domain-containing protein [Cellulomonas timonensis]
MTDATSRGGLINPAAFPAKSADLDISAIGDSAWTLRSMGQAVEEKTTTVKTIWDRLTGCYHAPEQEQVYTVMAPAVTSAQQVNSRFGEAATHIDTYAGALEAIKPRLADLERRATAFRAKVVNGVWIDAAYSANASFGDHVMSVLDPLPVFEKRRVKVSWTEDGDSVARNTALLEECAQILADISTAATTCARSINALMTGVCVAPVEAIPAAAFTSGEAQMPWGSPAVEDRNCVESVGSGAHTFGSEFLEGAGMLLVGYNPETGDWWTGAGYGQAWGGLGDLVGSVAVLGSPVGWVAAGMAATGNNDNAFSDWMYERATVARNAGGSLVGWDPTAEDGWHRWKEDGIAAGTSVALNVGTFFIPVAGQVGAGLKAGSIGARVARVAGAGAELAVQGGSWAVRGGVKVVTGLRTAVTRVDLDGLMPGARAGQLVDAGAGIRLNPGGLVNAMTDASHAAPSGAAHVPVREALFGRDTAPDLDTGARTAPDGPHSTREGQSPPASGEAPAVRDPHPAGPARDSAAPHPTAPAPESPHAPGGDSEHPNGHPDVPAGHADSGPDTPPDTPTPARALEQLTRNGAERGPGWRHGAEVPIDLQYGDRAPRPGVDMPSYVEPPAQVSEDVGAVGGSVDQAWGVDAVDEHPLTRSEWVERYVDEYGELRRPLNDGAVPGTKIIFEDPTLFAEMFGTKLDRVGKPGGVFLGVPPGTPWAQRSLTPDTLGSRVFQYAFDAAAAAREGVEIQVSQVAKAFGQPGGGIQVQFLQDGAEVIVQKMMDAGVLT